MGHSKVLPILIMVICASITVTAFAAQSITDRTLIDEDEIPLALDALDRFGYQIETIGDLDGDGTNDLAVTKFTADLPGEANVGSVLIMFMNSDGSVKSTNEILQDGTAGNIDSDCTATDTTNRETTTLEQLAFLGDLDGDGEPTLAVGASDNDHGVSSSGAIYNLELNNDGTVDNCFLIHPNNATHTSGFAPGNGVYQEGADGAFLGWPLIATDLNNDGRKELIAGASNEADTSTNLWPLFLNTTGGVDSHPATPIFGTTDLGFSDFLDDGDTLDGGTSIILSQQNGNGGGGTIAIATITSTGAFSSVTNVTNAVDTSDALGSGVTPLVDLDNDGVRDILIGNELGDDEATNAGEATIFYLNSDNTVKDSQVITNATEATRTGTIGPLKMTDLFGHGMDLWRTTTDTAYFAVSAHQSDNGGSNTGSIFIFGIEIAQDIEETPTTSGSSNKGGHGNTGVDVGQSIASYKKTSSTEKCKGEQLWKNETLRVYNIIVDKENQLVTVELKTTCGPANVHIETKYGITIAGIQMKQPAELGSDGRLEYLQYTAHLDLGVDKIKILVKDSRNVFHETINLNKNYIIKEYQHTTGYTSEQQGTPLLPVQEETIQTEENGIPRWIKSDLGQFNGHPARDRFFFDSVQYLIENDFITYTKWQQSQSLTEMKVYPEWMLNTVDSYVDGEITDVEFCDAMKYLIENRILRVGI